MVKEVIARCDICSGTEDVWSFDIELNGEARQVDLCQRHRGPLMEAFEAGSEREPKRRRRRSATKSKTHSVVPIEDIGMEEQ